MGIFAQITNGSVVNCVVADAASDLAPNGSWVDITHTEPMPCIGWSYGAGAFTAPAITTPALTLAQQAATALTAARTTVYNTYGILNEATPDAWVTYLKALMAIADGTDTTSTALPTQPTDVMVASTATATTS